MNAKRHFWKTQTKWVRYPAMIEAHCADATVMIQLHPERCATEKRGEPAMIFLTPHEAQGFASWLSGRADHLLAKQAKAAARAAERAAAKEAKR